MGTWGIARDMAKLNEENLSKLSKKGMYEKLKTRGSKSKGKIYKFKKATPEILKAIREKRILENQQLRKKKIILGSICGIAAILLLWITLTF